MPSCAWCVVVAFDEPFAILWVTEFHGTKTNIYHLMAMQSGCDPCASSHSNKSFHCLETMCISRVAAQRNDTFNFIS